MASTVFHVFSNMSIINFEWVTAIEGVYPSEVI